MKRRNLAEVVQSKRDEILRMAAEHGAHNVRLFGSLARGEADAHSDVDLLVEMEPGRSMLDRVRLIRELERLLGCRVDVATQRVLKPGIRENVLREAVAL
jgi:uncharacterized protein